MREHLNPYFFPKVQIYMSGPISAFKHAFGVVPGADKNRI
jgi:hypothetical protein